METKNKSRNRVKERKGEKWWGNEIESENCWPATDSNIPCIMKICTTVNMGVGLPHSLIE